MRFPVFRSNEEHGDGHGIGHGERVVAGAGNQSWRTSDDGFSSETASVVSVSFVVGSSALLGVHFFLLRVRVVEQIVALVFVSHLVAVAIVIVVEVAEVVVVVVVVVVFFALETLLFHVEIVGTAVHFFRRSIARVFELLRQSSIHGHARGFVGALDFAL